MAILTKTKQPRDVIDYDISFREYFEKYPGDEISVIELSQRNLIEGNPSQLTFGPGSRPPYELPGTKPQNVKVWIGGGDTGVDYVVSLLMTSTNGRVKEFDFRIKVRDQ